MPASISSRCAVSPQSGQQETVPRREPVQVPERIPQAPPAPPRETPETVPDRKAEPVPAGVR